MISVGVDVGTATTKIILSRLGFQNLGAAAGVPRLRLVSREVLYRSRVHETPVEGNFLQGARLLALMETAYAEAGVDPAAVETGGVIITGEAARKENARHLADLLAHRAGDFVVATAGPHLEAALAGRGSGAAARSEASGSTVAAVDLGGGTANIALFRQGRLLETACVNLGGRAIRFDPDTGQIGRVSPVARSVLAAAGVSLHEGQTLDIPLLQRAAATLATVIARALTVPPVTEAPGVYDGQPLCGGFRPDEVLISGGVGSFIDSPIAPHEALRHGDIGPALGWALRPALESRGLRVRRPPETTFATVIGVGVHALHLSGATIRIPDPSVLPLTNVPVIQPFADAAPAGAGPWAHALKGHAARLAADGPVAVAVAPLADISFAGLEQVALGIKQGLAEHLGRGNPLIVVTEQDVAAGLGLLLHTVGLGGVITVDEVQVADGHYIDIGRPLYQGTVVPVVVKTLVFGTGGEESP